ncbi:LysR family transcriptional regulator [Candidimonas nitroreducens]|uniref:LysR family transcriptional regulator n=1 Tax=Candidimonas nitroreducens TaxID=683354 RepID=A0A225MDC3_9BURK|nr:LysR family transcriptional regulator [Candidimonas nitroreducens]OWT59297.1 LysR family transcriptional regulator [Candidimonas nitroreducens]
MNRELPHLNIRRYDFTDLAVFLSVVESGTVTLGARRCHLSPTAVSLRIKRLEEDVGAALLTRDHRGVYPTAAGSVLVEHARLCVAQIEQMHTDMLPFSQGLTGHVILFANTNAINSYLPDDLAIFFERFPNVRIALEERTSHEIVSAVAQGRADVGVVAMHTMHPDLEFLPYREDELVVLVPSQHDLSRRERIEFAECIGCPFISLQSGAALHTFLTEHSQRLGRSLDIRIQVTSYGAITRLVSSGAGIGIIAKSALIGTERGVAVLQLDELWAKRDLRVCVKREPSHNNIYRDRLVSTLRRSETRDSTPMR